MNSRRSRLAVGLRLGVSAIGLVGYAAAASAGGFALREQSTLYQGMAFAGSAAGDGLSAIFWNPAATANFDGMNTSSNYAVIFPDADITVTDVKVPSTTVPLPSPPFPPGSTGSASVGGFNSAGSNSGDIASLAVVSASYGNYQVSPNVYIGMGFNAPFGLTTEPEDEFYQGSVLARTARLFTLNGNPTIGVKLAPGVMVGAGAQIEYADGTFKFATGSPASGTTAFDGDDYAFGGTAGVLLQPSDSTSIGLGWRSQLSHTLEGTFRTEKTKVPVDTVTAFGTLHTFQKIAATTAAAEVDLNLPDIVTLSLRQKISGNLRLLGTVEWSNWSRFEELRVKARGDGKTVFGNVKGGDTIAVIDAGWQDGWFFSAGTEYDWTDTITFRGGVAYEISPVDSPEARIISIPDADRVWLSAGLSYKMTAATTIDVAATHIWIEDGAFDRTSLSGTRLQGTVDASTTILSAGLRTKW